jgi:RNA polymerase sigma-70 factor, ECF subfamily
MASETAIYTADSLTALLAADDAHAFENLFRTYYTELGRFAMKYLRDKETAEELVQDLFVDLWEKRHTLNITGSVKSYLYTATKNRSLNYLKSKLAQLQQLGDDSSELAAHHSNTESLYDQNELEQIIANGIEALPEKCRIIFQLSRHAGLSYAEIAQELNLSPKTVENQMGTALKKLRSYLEVHWDQALPVVVLWWLEV